MKASTKSDPTAPKTVVNAVVHAAAIMRFLAETTPAHGVTSIAAALNLSASTCFNTLKTLVAEDFVQFDAKTKTYSIGLGIFELGRRAISRNGIYNLAKPRMQAMAEQYDLTGGLWRVAPTGELVLVGVADNPSEMRIHFVVGQRLLPFVGASGRCQVATSSLSPEQIAKGLESAPPRRVPPVEVYLAEIEDVKLRGWAIDSNDYQQGVTSVAAPILNEEGAMSFALTNSMFQGQHPPAIVDRIGRETLEIARLLSSELFGQSGVRG